MPTILTKDDGPRYSFDRIDDDLCEVLLSYLSLEHKFRFECVSKQFKRCIYQKQNQLKVDFKMTTKMKRTDLLGHKYIDLQLFDSILKKCQNIHQISIETISNQSESKYKEMFELIINNCNYLSSIDLYFTETQEEVFRQFFTKFGPRLRKIGFNSDSYLNESHLVLCKRLNEINIKRLKPSYLRQLFFEDNNIPLNKLKKIHMKCSAQECNDFDLFVQKCKNSLQFMDLIIDDFDENTVFNVLNGVKELKELKTLEIAFDLDIAIDFSIVEQLKQIAINCPNIKNLVLKLRTRNWSRNLDIFNAIKHFNQLKRFDFNFDYTLKTLKNRNHFSCHSLKGCHELTHLTINGSRMFDDFFDKISTYLPKLEFLNVSNAKVSEVSFLELSKLKNLRTLSLHLYHTYSIGHIIHVIQNCPKLHLIDLLTVGLHVVLDELEIEEIREEPDTLAHFLRIDFK